MGVVDASELSKAVFGNKHMLTVAAMIAAGPSVTTQREIARETGLPDSTVRLVVLRLVDAGALHALPRSSSSQYFERSTSPIWDFATALRSVAAEGSRSS
jgi:hypothetical protein